MNKIKVLIADDHSIVRGGIRALPESQADIEVCEEVADGREAVEAVRNLIPDVQEFVITGHYSIDRGGCLIETNSGTIDAQINTQLAVVEEVFRRIREEYDIDEETLEESVEEEEDASEEGAGGGEEG